MRFGCYSQPSGVSPTDWAFLKSAGMSVVRANYYAPHRWQDWPLYADECAALGLLLDVDVGEEVMAGTGFLSMIEPIAEHPAIHAVHLWDEPVLNIARGYRNYLLSQWLDSAQAFQERFPNMKSTCAQSGISYGNAYQEVQISMCSELLDLCGYDEYFRPTYIEQKQWAQWMGALSPGKHVVALLQGFGNLTRDQLRQMVLGARDGGAYEVRWWFGNPDMPPMTHRDSQLWADIVAVTEEFSGDIDGDGLLTAKDLHLADIIGNYDLYRWLADRAVGNR